MPLNPGQHIGAYRVVRLLGQGGMGVVYEAVHGELGRRVALKLLHPQRAADPQIAARLVNEARAAILIEHPGTVQVWEIGQMPDGAAYIVMELLRGESLSARLRASGGRLSLRSCLQLLRQLASALGAAHARGIVHRDLKPDNVMLVTDPDMPGGIRAKLLDFGIAKLAGAARAVAAGKETGTAEMMGTPLYMSPEQCRGAGGVTDRADVYSLGVLAFQLLAGRMPFVGEGLGEIMGKHMYEPAPRLVPMHPEAPPALVPFVARMIEKDPAARPSMAEVLAQMEALLDAPGDPAAATPPAGSPATPSTGVPSTLGWAAGQAGARCERQRSWRFAISGGLALLTMLVTGLYGARRWGTSEPPASFRAVAPREMTQPTIPAATPPPAVPQPTVTSTPAKADAPERPRITRPVPQAMGGGASRKKPSRAASRRGQPQPATTPARANEEPANEKRFEIVD